MMTSTLPDRYTPAIEQIRQWHGAQQRKYSFEPYWTHPVTVAEVIQPHLPEDEAILAALFHDVVEDTSFGPDHIFDFLRSHYGQVDAVLVIDTVMDLTNRYEKDHCPGLNRAERHRLETLRLSRISPFAQSIKYGDIFHNCRSIQQFAPDYARIYLAEKQTILEVMDQGHIPLREQVMDLVSAGIHESSC